MTRILIAASGTGGHLFPALAVAEALSKSWEVSWLGVPNRLETELVPKNFELITVRAGGLNGHGIRKFFQLCQLLAAAFKVFNLHRSKRIDVVFTTGGYIAAPAILGAICCGIPVILHESNAFPGKVSRLMGRFCNVVALGLPSASKYLAGCKTINTGTPIRSSFFAPQALPAWVPVGKGPLIVVMGGSQGALGLNLMVRAVTPFLLREGCRVVHLTGHNDSDLEGEIKHQNFVAKSFSNQIPALLQHADLAISRAGAGSLSEMAVCGTPAILVPYPLATDQHQNFNAVFAAQLGAAVIVHQHQPEDDVLRETLGRLLRGRLDKSGTNSDPLIKMKLAMLSFAEKESEETLVKILHEFI